MKQIQNIEESVIKIISTTLNVPETDLALEQKLDDICADSIQIFSLIMALEKEFEHQACYEDLVKIETVGDIIKYIETERKKSA